MPGSWKKVLVYLGLVEEEDELEPLPEVHEQPQLETVRPIRGDMESSAVRRIGPPDVPSTVSSGPVTSPSVGVMAAPAALHVVEPKSFNDAPEIGDRLKSGQPVIMNLQQADGELAKRLIDFSSGLTYMASGTIKKVADRVFLLTPSGVDVTAEETQRFINERGFFNQF